MFERPYLKLIKARTEEPRMFIQFILGPRQVGKTTMITQLLSQLSIANLYESADAISTTNLVGVLNSMFTSVVILDRSL